MIRDTNGAWRGGFSKHRYLKRRVVELWRVFEGLKQVFAKGHGKIELHIDSIQVFITLTTSTKIETGLGTRKMELQF